MLDYSLNPKTILTSDPYDVLVRKQLQEGSLTKPANFDYWQDFMQTKMQHWDGKQWKPAGGWAKWE